MKTRLPLTLLAALLAGTAASAQFDFSKLTKLVDTVKDVAKVAKVAAGIGPEEERTIGQSVALEILGKYGGLVRDPAIMRRVNLVGRALAYYSDRPELEWRFGVLDSDSVNAFSAPAGYVFITRGLYDLAKNDDELAAILGHEIAHITQKHALSVVRLGEASSLAADQLTKHSGDVRAAQATVGQVKSQVGQISPEAAKFVDLNTSTITNLLFVKGFDKPSEFEADKLGRALAVRTGYASGGLRAALSALLQRGGDQNQIFGTHPPLAERIKRLPDEPALGGH